MVDRPPFAAAVDAGVPAVMTAHLAFPALDPSGVAATLSPAIVGELRSGLGFEGVIMTDALDMGGVAQGRSPGDVAVGSVLAGADMLLMSPDLRAAQAAVRQAVEAGTITPARLEASVRRILTLKEQVGALGPPHPLPDLSVVGSDDHRLLRARVGG
jgi:beta-N-acetylhexosaminidase